jgi:hypothetical protein
MGEVLKTRDEPWLGPVRLNRAANGEGMERVAPRPRLDSPPQLPVAAQRASERALELAAHDRVLSPFLVDPVPDLLERYASRDTAHADLISEIFELRAGLEGAGASTREARPLAAAAGSGIRKGPTGR